MRPSPRGLYHTQVCCTQSSCPCDRSLSTCTSTRDTPAQFCLSLCGVPGSWCAHGLFEPSEHLWHEWGLLLKVISPLLPSYWGFSFALGRGASPHSHFSAYVLTGFFLTLVMGYLHRAAASDPRSGVYPLHCSLYFFCIQFLSVRTYVVSISWLLQIILQ